MPDISAAEVNAALDRSIFSDNDGSGPLIMDLTTLSGEQTLADEMARPIFKLLQAMQKTARAANKATTTYPAIRQQIRVIGGVPTAQFIAAVIVRASLSYSVSSLTTTSNTSLPIVSTPPSSNELLQTTEFFLGDLLTTKDLVGDAGRVLANVGGTDYSANLPDGTLTQLIGSSGLPMTPAAPDTVLVLERGLVGTVDRAELSSPPLVEIGQNEQYAAAFDFQVASMTSTSTLIRIQAGVSIGLRPDGTLIVRVRQDGGDIAAHSMTANAIEAALNVVVVDVQGSSVACWLNGELDSSFEITGTDDFNNRVASSVFAGSRLYFAGRWIEDNKPDPANTYAQLAARLHDS